MKNFIGMNASQLFAVVRIGSRMTFAPHNGSKAGWKLNAAGDAIELKDGNPIWINTDGSETTMGGDTITRLNAEAATNRQRYEKAEGIAEQFKGLDPVKAREALETISKIDQKKLIDAGEVDKVRQSIGTEWQGKLDEANKATEAANARADNYLLDNAFKGSKFVTDKLTVPVDMVQATFGRNFKVEDGKVYAFDAQGNKIPSKTRAGEYASLDEALDILVEGYAHKDHILKGGNHEGSGGNGGGNGGGGKRTYRRSEIDAMQSSGDAAKIAGIMESINKGDAQLVD